MKITDIDLTKTGDVYVDERNVEWEVFGCNLYRKGTLLKLSIGEDYNLQTLLTMTFEPVVDWSKVEVDTPVWVNGEPYHFESYYECDLVGAETKHIRVWCNGRTSHTSDSTFPMNVDGVSLTKPKE